MAARLTRAPSLWLNLSLWNIPLKNPVLRFKKTRKTISLLMVICALVFANLWAGKALDHLVPPSMTTTAYAIQTQEAPFKEGASSLVISSEVDTKWRRTKNGWQDPATWPAGAQFAPIKPFESVHPFVWAGIVLFSVIATMIWASSEWEVAQLFDQETTESSGEN